MRTRRALAYLAPAVAVVAIWAYVVNRVIIQWEDGPLKNGCAIGFGLGLVAFAQWTGRPARRGAWAYLWGALLLGFAAGEARRWWLLNEYRGDSRESALWPAVTTTDLEVRRFRAEVPGLGARVRVVHLTDLHVRDSEPESYWPGVVREIETASPDLVVMTGDYLSRAERLPLLERRLSLLPHAPLGTYAVLGNHDYWAGEAQAVRAALQRAGVQRVGGRCVTVWLSGPTAGDGSHAGALRVCGNERPWGPAYPAPEEGAVTVALTHTPDNVYPLSKLGASVVFAGHTHAGQVRLPWLGAVVVPSDYGRRFDEGHFVVDGTHLFVSAGIGADAPPLRLWCRPELLVVDLLPGGER